MIFWKPLGFKQLDNYRKDVLLLAAKNLPVSFFDDALTQEYFEDLNSERQHARRNSMRDKIIVEHAKMSEKLIEILKVNESKISFCVDGWTSGNFKGFYGVTAHFMNKLWGLISVILDLVPCKRKHCGKDIADLFVFCLKKYDIVNKIGGITVDNA